MRISQLKSTKAIEKMPFFETFHNNGKAIIDIELFEKWIDDLRCRNFVSDGDETEGSIGFEDKIRLIREAMNDSLFRDDFKNIEADFQFVDSEGWK